MQGRVFYLYFIDEEPDVQANVVTSLSLSRATIQTWSVFLKGLHYATLLVYWFWWLGVCLTFFILINFLF